MTHATVTRRSSVTSMLVPGATLLAWGTAVFLLAANGRFAVPETLGIPVPTVAAILSPVALFLLAERVLPGVRAWALGLDPALVAGTQIWRAFGLVFIFFWLAGRLPATFAILAGFGDLAVGIVALWVTLRVARRSPGWQRASRRLVALGMGDFVVAVTVGIMSQPGLPLHAPGQPSPEALQALPLVLIPGFAVPVFIILHRIAWLQSRAAE